MGSQIQPQWTTIDGLAIRYAQSTAKDVDAILLSPWPQTIYAFDRVWATLADHAHLVVVDPPGFGKSEGRTDLLNPKAMGDFIIKIADTFELAHPHLVGPDIGTSSSLFAAAAAPGRFATVVVGSGGAAVPVDVRGVLKSWVEATDLQPYRNIGGRKIVAASLATVAGYTHPDDIREDYLSAYEGDRFAETIPYAHSYLQMLPLLADLLPTITAPVRIVAGGSDPVVPPVNATFLHERLPHSRIDLIDGAGHFCWEEQPVAYASLVAQWWNAGSAAHASNR